MEGTSSVASRMAHWQLWRLGGGSVKNAFPPVRSPLLSTTKPGRSTYLPIIVSVGPWRVGKEEPWQIEDTPKGVFFDATLPPESKQPSWMVDAVLSVRAGLTQGDIPRIQRSLPDLSLPMRRSLIPEPGNAAVQIRQINQAVLFELSLVTRPQYLGTEIDIRAENLSPTQLEEAEAKAKAALIRRAYRWL